MALAGGYNPETCPSQNMQMMIALACRATNMTLAEAIAAATINAAYAHGGLGLFGSSRPARAPTCSFRGWLTIGSRPIILQ